MTPERWRKVKDVLGVALERDEPGRAALLEELRADDPALAQEVESLVASYEETPDEPRRAEAAELPAGSRLGPYEVVALIGRGGMGHVYRARDTRLGREVALKVLAGGLSDRPAALKRLEREARAIAALSHPNIVGIHDFSGEGGPPFVVTELLVGETLRVRLADGALPVPVALDYARQAARGLAAAHEKGIVHRDLKPENLFLTDARVLKILDFGLAKQSPLGDGTGPGALAYSQSHPGLVLGTVGYMAPEQIRGVGSDARTDIFSLGAVLYEMLMGRRPFERESGIDTLAAILRDEPARVNQLSKAGRLAPVVIRCLEKQPDRRFASGRELLEALDAISASEITAAWRPPPRVLRTAGLTLLAATAVVLAAAVWLRRANSTTDPVGVPPIEFRKNGRDGAEYARIPAGTFAMGCTPANDFQEGCRSVPWESPPSAIAIARPYWLMRTEVTVGEFTAFARATARAMPEAPSFDPSWEQIDHPVVNVTWFEARDYCGWAGGRLPSEAEWERAGRGSQDWAFAWGPSERPTVDGKARANTRDTAYERKYGMFDIDGWPEPVRANGYDDGYAETSPAGRFSANDFGLFDIGGNVSEWCQDKADPRPIPGTPADNLKGKPSDGRARDGDDARLRIVRDGNWRTTATPVFRRFAKSPFGRDSVTGFRCARDTTPLAPR